MEVEEFRKRGEEMVDYIADYMDSVSERRVKPDADPGYLVSLLPTEAPEKKASFDEIMEDVEKLLMPGITHWQHPRFHAYFPASSSYPSTLGEMMADTVGPVGFNWDISPAGKELETIVLDWMAKMMNLPQRLHRYGDISRGGGIIQNSSSECILITMIAARNDVIKREQTRNPSMKKATVLTSLVAYCSNESHSCVEKAAMISMVTIKILETDEDYRLRGNTLERYIKEDKKQGLIPFYASVTLGTTSCCACDPIDEIGPVCEAYELWLNVDAAYGGPALICPEFDHLRRGFGYISSLNVNPAKWFLTNIECAVLFTTDRFKINESLAVDKTLLCYNSGEKDWGCPINRRCRCFKLWFVIRCYGVEGLQAHIRNHVRLAELFAYHAKNDHRFEVLTCNFGLVCFRLKGSNTMNKKLLMWINASFKLHIIACCLHGMFVLRFCVCSPRATNDDIIYAWGVIDHFATELNRVEMLRYSGTSINYEPDMDSGFS